MRKTGVFFLIIVLFFGFNNSLFAQYQLAGSVNYNGNDDLPIPEVTLGLYDLQDILVVSTETDENGNYFFSSIPSGAYHLRSSSNLEPETVDIQDSYLVLMSLLNWIELDEIQSQAADINNNGSVTWNDYFYIVSDYLTHGEAFPAGVWQFEEAYIDFTSREDPPDTTDLWGITEGDVEGMWEPSGRDLNILDYSYYPVQMANNEFQVDINTNYNNQIAGFSINVAYPANQLNIIDVTGPDGNLNYVVDEDNGFVKIIWLDENNSGRISGDKLLTLTVETKSSENENIAFELMHGSMLIDAKGKEIEDVEIQLPMLEKNQDIELSISSAYPNPFVDVVNINLNLDEANLASMSIFDVTGKLVLKTDNISLNKGEQSITVDTQSFKPGYYIYMIDLVGGTKYSATGQIVKSN